MKKLFTLATATMLASGSLMAYTVNDIFISGSTAFRNNAYDASIKLFDTNTAPTIITDGNATPNKSTYWAMSGTMTNILGAANNQVITIHGSFNGSVAGIYSLGQKFGYQFYVSSSSTTFITNTPTAVFSDVDSSVTTYPLGSAYWEKNVAVQPFVYVKSASPSVSAINNVGFGQLQQMLANGTAPLSQFTGTNTDTATVYLVQRTADSGTRVTSYLEAQSFSPPNNIYYYSSAGNAYYLATTNMYTDPLFIAGNFGPGYVGGGNIATVLGSANTGNTAIGYLSFADAKTIGSAAPWSLLCSYNGQYPVLNYVPGTTPGTNDFAPVRYGQYSFWAYEDLDWPKQAQYTTYTDQQMPYGTASAILNKLAGYNGTTTTGGSLVGGRGSVDNEVANQVPPTAISIFTMHCSRPTVGGPIGTF
jgi:hypothetical protein